MESYWRSPFREWVGFQIVWESSALYISSNTNNVRAKQRRVAAIENAFDGEVSRELTQMTGFGLKRNEVTCSYGVARASMTACTVCLKGLYCNPCISFWFCARWLRPRWRPVVGNYRWRSLPKFACYKMLPLLSMRLQLQTQICSRKRELCSATTLLLRLQKLLAVVLQRPTEHCREANCHRLCTDILFAAAEEEQTRGFAATAHICSCKTCSRFEAAKAREMQFCRCTIDVCRCTIGFVAVWLGL